MLVDWTRALRARLASSSSQRASRPQQQQQLQHYNNNNSNSNNNSNNNNNACLVTPRNLPIKPITNIIIGIAKTLRNS